MKITPVVGKPQPVVQAPPVRKLERINFDCSPAEVRALVSLLPEKNELRLALEAALGGVETPHVDLGDLQPLTRG